MKMHKLLVMMLVLVLLAALGAAVKSAMTLSAQVNSSAHPAATADALAFIHHPAGNNARSASASGGGDAESHKVVSARTPNHGETVTYTVVVQNLGAPLTATVHLTDVVPSGLLYVSDTLTATAGAINAALAPTLTWAGELTPAPAVTITYAVTVSAPATQVIVNTATIAALGYQAVAPTATIVANGYRVYLPLVMKSNPHPAGSGSSFTFAITADMRYFSGPGPHDTPQYFRGACEAIAALGSADFMVSPGDVDPPASVYWTITQTLGTAYTWYPVVGNHEIETAADVAWLRAYDYGAVSPGPPSCPTTTYSFDYQNAHFMMLNEYCDATGATATDGDVPNYLYNWLVDDLNGTTKKHIFVIGHEPAYPQPDAESGRIRHGSSSLNKYPANRDRFWNLLRDKGVVAYINGHTHNYSAVEVNGVWQLDAGHARGLGDANAQSTFVLIHVNGNTVTFETYRAAAAGGPYTLAHSGILIEQQ